MTKKKQTYNCAELFREAIELANSIEKAKTKARVLAEIARSLYRAGQTEQADMLIERAMSVPHLYDVEAYTHNPEEFFIEVLVEIGHPVTGERVKYGVPQPFCGEEIIPDWEGRISDLFPKTLTRARYVYDFGDGWGHSVKLEKILDREKGARYPRCVNGERACPPEDCGGVWGYEEILKIRKNPGGRNRVEMWALLAKEFDPERFDATAIKFVDPEKYRRKVLG